MLVMSKNSHCGHRISMSVFDASLLGLLDQVGRLRRLNLSLGRIMAPIRSILAVDGFCQGLPDEDVVEGNTRAWPLL